MLTNIDINKMNHLLETNEDARQIITRLLKNHQEAVSLISHRNTKSAYFNFLLPTDNGTGIT